MQTGRLILVRHGSTDAVRLGAFPLDEPLDRFGAAAAQRLAPALPRIDEARCGPFAAARETASALGVDAGVDQALAAWDFGRWRGLGLAELEQSDPRGIAAWLGDPAAAPHGGESLLDLLERVRGWLQARAGRGRRLLAITDGAFIRAAVVVALDAPPPAFWRIDVAPLSVTTLVSRDGRWTVRSISVARDSGE